MKTREDRPQEGDLPRLAQPAQRALAAAGIHWLDQLSAFTEAEIGRLHGIGPNALATLRRALADRGLTFAAEKEK